MKNQILEKNNTKTENIYFMKYIIMDDKEVSRKDKIQNIINKNRVYKKEISNISEIDKLAYNI